jgi:hypothetical protein
LTGELPAATGRPWFAERDEPNERRARFGENDFLTGYDWIHQAREMGFGGLNVDRFHDPATRLNQVWSDCKEA